jgi:hypothetical protein
MKKIGFIIANNTAENKKTSGGNRALSFSPSASTLLKYGPYGGYLESLPLKKVLKQSVKQLASRYFLIVSPWSIMPEKERTALATKLFYAAQQGMAIYWEGPLGDNKRLMAKMDLTAPVSMDKALRKKDQWNWQITARPQSDIAVGLWPVLTNEYKISYAQAWAARKYQPFSPQLRKVLPLPVLRSLKQLAFYRPAEKAETLEAIFMGKKKIGVGLTMRTLGRGVFVFHALPLLDYMAQISLSVTSAQPHLWGFSSMAPTGIFEYLNNLLALALTKAGLAVPSRHYLPGCIRWTCIPAYDCAYIPPLLNIKDGKTWVHSANDMDMDNMYEISKALDYQNRLFDKKQFQTIFKSGRKKYMERVYMYARLNHKYGISGGFLNGWSGVALPITDRDWVVLNRLGQECGYYYSRSRWGYESDSLRQNINTLDKSSRQNIIMVRDSGFSFGKRPGGWGGREMFLALERAFPGRIFCWNDPQYSKLSTAYPLPLIDAHGSRHNTFTLMWYGGDHEMYQDGGLERWRAAVDSCYQCGVPFFPHIHPWLHPEKMIRKRYGGLLDYISRKRGFKGIGCREYVNYNVQTGDSVQFGCEFQQSGKVKLAIQNAGPREIRGLTFHLPDGARIKRSSRPETGILVRDNFLRIKSLPSHARLVLDFRT